MGFVNEARSRIDGNLNIVAIPDDFIRHSVTVKIGIGTVCKGRCLRAVETSRNLRVAENGDFCSQSRTPVVVGCGIHVLAASRHVPCETVAEIVPHGIAFNHIG